MKHKWISVASVGFLLVGAVLLDGGISSPSNVAVVTTPSSGSTAVTEWYGPFSSWDNVKTKYGARGDGVADDTAALSAALANVGSGSNSPVLYLPAGTYRVTQTLLLQSKSNIEIWGADPAATTIRWDGAAGGTLFWLDGTDNSHLGRLTFDGNTKANIAFDHSKQNGTYFDGNNVFDDCVFKNATYGVRGGAYGEGFASVVFNRCVFQQLTYGLSTWNWNALDGYLNQCVVENCQRGLYVYQGSSQVYGTIFRNNQWDIFYVPATPFFSAVSNTSYHSGGFLYMGDAGWNSSPVLLKGNQVIDPTNAVPIQVGQYGPLVLLDNIVAQQSGAVGPAIQCSNYWAPDVLAVGNSFTVGNWLTSSGTAIRSNLVDNTVVSRASLSLANPPDPAVAVNLNRPLMDLGASDSGVAIQNAINSADNGALIHIPWGDHGCASPVVIAAGKVVTLVGDGPRSQLSWNGASGSGPLLELPAPSQATLAHLGLEGYSRALPLVQVDGVGSQPARVLLKDSWVTHATLANLRLGDCPKATVDQFAVSSQYAQAANAVNVLLEGRGKVRWFCVDSGDNMATFICTNGGTLYAETSYYEGPGNNNQVYARVSGNSTATILSAKMAVNDTGTTSNAVQVTNFNGNFLFGLVGNLTDWLRCSGGGSGNVWALGNSSLSSVGEFYLTNTTSSVRLVASLNQYLSSNGHLKVPDQGSADPSWVRTLVVPARTEYPLFLPYNRLGTQTDVLLNRVFLSEGQVNLWIKP